jgi:hypothetical protein
MTHHMLATLFQLVIVVWGVSFVKHSWEGQGDTHFQLAFSYTGTRSYSQYLAMTDALAFRQYLGGEQVIMEYMHSLAVDAGEWHPNKRRHSQRRSASPSIPGSSQHMFFGL